jgi:hypothetical protein
MLRRSLLKRDGTYNDQSANKKYTEHLMAYSFATCFTKTNYLN